MIRIYDIAPIIRKDVYGKMDMEGFETKDFKYRLWGNAQKLAMMLNGIDYKTYGLLNSVNQSLLTENDDMLINDNINNGMEVVINSDGKKYLLEKNSSAISINAIRALNDYYISKLSAKDIAVIDLNNSDYPINEWLWLASNLEHINCFKLAYLPEEYWGLIDCLKADILIVKAKNPMDFIKKHERGNKLIIVIDELNNLLVKSNEQFWYAYIQEKLPISDIEALLAGLIEGLMHNLDIQDLLKTGMSYQLSKYQNGKVKHDELLKLKEFIIIQEI